MEETLGVSYRSFKNVFDTTSHTNNSKYIVVRYTDDFVIFARNKDNIFEFENILQPYLEEIDLILVLDKTSL